MMPILAKAAVVWAAVLLAALSMAASARGSLMAKILWVDTLALVLIALVAAIGYVRASPGYLDVAIVLALLSFAGTLAAVRFHDEGHL